MKTEIKIPGFGGKVKLKDLAVMSRQFADDDQLRSLAAARADHPGRADREQGARPASSREVRNDVETGTALSAALAKHPEVFPPLMVNMTRAGEVGGFLDAVLLQIAENYEAEVKLRGKIKSAMTYPVVVFVMAILAVDRHAAVHRARSSRSMFDDLGGTLPAPTRVLIFLSRRAEDRASRSSSSAYRRVHDRLGARSSTPSRSRNVVDPLKLKMPVFGTLFQKIALARFARNLGTMLRSGVPILQSLDIVADTTGNVVARRRGARRAGERPQRRDALPARWRTTRSSRRWSCR